MSEPRPPDLEALDRTRREIAGGQEKGRAAFTSITEWKEGARSISQLRGHSVATDEPQALGGQDEAPDPMELLLAALGSCLTIGWVKQAELRGVTVRSLKITVSAPYDLRGYLDLAEEVRPGFSELVYQVTVDCDASPTLQAEIMAAAERSSPLFDNILNGTPLRGVLAPPEA
ncbi:MAG: OsmC family protein [Pseudomonadota bacterium]